MTLFFVDLAKNERINNDKINIFIFLSKMVKEESPV